MRNYVFLLFALLMINCSQDNDQVEPKREVQSFRLDRVVVTNFPRTDANNSDWDIASSGPDLKLYLVDENNDLVYNFGGYFENATPSERYSFVVKKDVELTKGESYSLLLYDFDSTSEDDYMGGIKFFANFDEQKTEDEAVVGDVSMIIHYTPVF